MKKILILLMFLAFSSRSAEAGQRVLAIQSVSAAPYEQAVKGFESVSGAVFKRLFIAEQKEKDVLKTINEIRPDMVLAVGRDALLITRQIKTIPVVYCMVLNPLSILDGKKNISGVSMNLPPEKQLVELLKVLPALHSIGLLYDPVQTGDFIQGLKSATSRTNVNLTATAVHRSGDVPGLLNTIKGKAGVFWMLPDITVLTPETFKSIQLFSLENKMPILTFSEKYLELGAMLSIGIDPYDVGVQAGEMTQNVFSGRNIRQDQHVDARKALLSVNLEIAGKLGIVIDPKSTRDIKIIK